MKNFLIGAVLIGSSLACASTAVLSPESDRPGKRTVLSGEDVVLKDGQIFAPTGSSVRGATIVSQYVFDEMYAEAQEGTSQIAKEADDTLSGGDKLMMIDPRDCSWSSSDTWNVIAAAGGCGATAASVGSRFGLPGSIAGGIIGATGCGLSTYKAADNEQIQCQMNRENDALREENELLKREVDCHRHGGSNCEDINSNF